LRAPRPQGLGVAALVQLLIHTQIARLRDSSDHAGRVRCLALRRPPLRPGATMGALHGDTYRCFGGQSQCEVVAHRSFVNLPNRSPRRFSEISASVRGASELLHAEGCRLLFAPGEEMYPPGAVPTQRRRTQRSLCGAPARDFRGVATVVRIVHVVQPEVAFFGQKMQPRWP